MPKIIIDGKEFEFKPGQMVIEVAKENGIKIPHFCWHPGLSISGNCRICLVEIEKIPKLAIACSTLASDGMVVNTKSEKTVKAQNAVMEFLLINHPLDCPICDEAGECKLQDYAYKYSKGYSRYDEEKNHKDKRVELGPNVMFDGERCISCSRCIRFCEEIAKDPELTFIQRGEKVTITTFPGEKLDNPYSMNVIEICPVGALTSRHFRFRARVWDMSFTDSICPGCSRGCNSIIGVRNNEILRVTPRVNQEVNKWWLCDWGRLNTIKYVNDGKLRVDSPLIKLEGNRNNGETHIPVEWDIAVTKANTILLNKKDEILFVASPFSTVEDNYVFKKFTNEVFNSENIIYFPNTDETFGDDILRKSDKTPNSTGLKLLGIREATEKDISEIKSGKYKILYSINEDITRVNGLIDAHKYFENLILNSNIKSNLSVHSDIEFPESTYAEINGTFINFQKRIQRIRPAVATFEQERILGEYSLSRLDKFGAHNDRWTQGKKFNSRPTWKIIKQLAKSFGHNFEYENSEEVFIEFCKKNILKINDCNYEKMGDKGLQL
jgi:NADH-quinone oxidoreductase subunit G